jgi:cytochrome c556
MRRRPILLVTALFMLVTLLLAATRADEPKRPRDPIMQQKLTSAQKVLEGIAVKDFDLIEKNADNLMILSKKAEWMVLKTPDYTRHSDDFRRNCETLMRAAKDKNVDGAALAYVQLTMNCVNCHKYVREVRVALK